MDLTLIFIRASRGSLPGMKLCKAVIVILLSLAKESNGFKAYMIISEQHQ